MKRQLLLIRTRLRHILNLLDDVWRIVLEFVPYARNFLPVPPPWHSAQGKLPLLAM